MNGVPCTVTRTAMKIVSFSFLLVILSQVSINSSGSFLSLFHARCGSTCKQELVEARWMMEAQVLSYQNPTGFAAGNWGKLFCCDQDHNTADGVCSNPCDSYMFFCLQRVLQGSSLLYCTYGSYTTEVVGSEASITFAVGKNLSQGVPNPLVFYGDNWINDVSIYYRSR